MKQDIKDSRFLSGMRWAIASAVACVIIMGIMWWSSWLTDVVRMDTLYLSRAVIFLTLAYVVHATVMIWKFSHELNVAKAFTMHLKRGETDACHCIESGNSRLSSYLEEIQGLSAEDRRDIADTFDRSMSNKICSVLYNMSRLTTFGFVCTLFGATLALQGFDNPLTDVSNIIDLLKVIPPGLRVAIYPALLGGIGAFWIDHLYQILETSKEQLMSEIIKAGVRRANTSSYS